MRSARIPAAGILLAGIAASAAGQAAEAPAWGTQDPSVLTLFAWDFQPTASSVSYGAEFFSIYSSTIDFRFFSAGVRLPSGARVTAIQLEGCDESIGGRIVFGFQVLASPVGGVTTPLAG